MHREFVRSRLIANWSKLYLAVAYGGGSGELLNVVKKEHRDKKDMREEVRQKAADCLFCLSALLDRYDLSFEDCYQASYEKLTDANTQNINSNI